MQFPNFDESRIGFAKEEDRDGDAMYVGINKTYSCLRDWLRLEFGSYDPSSMVITNDEDTLKTSKSLISSVATRFRNPSLGGPQPQPQPPSALSTFLHENNSDRMESEESEAYAALDSIVSKYGVQTLQIHPHEDHVSYANTDRTSESDAPTVDSSSFRAPTLRAASWIKEPHGEKSSAPTFNASTSGGTTSSVTFPPPDRMKAGGGEHPWMDQVGLL